MKVLVRHVRNQDYIVRRNNPVEWSKLEHEAMPFPDLESAAAYCSTLSLDPVELVVKYGLDKTMVFPLPLRDLKTK